MIKKSIKKYCQWCSNYQVGEIKQCSSNDCPLYSLRLGNNPNRLRRLKAITKRCLDCKGDSKTNVRKCEEITCPLFPYRMGNNPARKGLGNKDIRKTLGSIKQVIE